MTSTSLDCFWVYFSKVYQTGHSSETTLHDDFKSSPYLLDIVVSVNHKKSVK